MANVDAAAGDTLYQLNAPAGSGMQLLGGNHADGSRYWIANIDPTAVITVEVHGAHTGIERYNLSSQGDRIYVPAGDVNMVNIFANQYPAWIGYGYLDPGYDLSNEPFETNMMPGAAGVQEFQDGNTGAAAALTATIGGVLAGHTNYLAGFAVSGGGATAASVIAVTVTGLAGGTKTWYLAIPAGVTSQVLLQQTFPRPLPGILGGAAIVVNVPSFGAGNTAAAVMAWGYRA